MKQKLILAFVVIFTIKSFAQDSKFSIEASYPLPVDNNLIGENYTGLIDIGASYKFKELTSFNIGASINTGILKNTKDNISPVDIVTYAIQPRIFAELDVEVINKFHPRIGLGYTFMIFDVSGTVDGVDVSDLDDDDDNNFVES